MQPPFQWHIIINQNNRKHNNNRPVAKYTLRKYTVLPTCGYCPTVSRMPEQALSPRQSAALISSRSRHVSVDADAAARCAQFLLGRMDEGRIALKDLFQSTDVHPKVINNTICHKHTIIILDNCILC